MATKFELAQLSYAEVLDATKHQDDKIGRILGALAFFVAGALAFLDPSTVSTTHRVGGDDVHLVAIALGTFLVLSFMSALLYVLSTTAPLAFRGRIQATGQSKSVGGTGLKSHLYFTQIAKLSESDWVEEWNRTDDELEKAVTADLIRETHNIAVRVREKYSRSREAAALLHTAIPFLVMTLLLSLDAIVSNAGEVPLDWDAATRRLPVGVALASFAGLRLFYEGARSDRSTGLVLVTFPLAILVNVLVRDTSWTSFVLVVATNVGAIVFFLRAYPNQRGSERWASGGVAVICLTAAVSTATEWAPWASPDLWRLSVAVLLTSALPLAELGDGLARLIRG